MDSLTFPDAPALPAKPMEVVRDQAAHLMSMLTSDPNVTPEDLQTLQGFYTELEQRRTRLEQSVNDDLRNEKPEAVTEDIQPTDKEQAFQFTGFLASLDPSDETTKLMIQGSKKVVAALGLVEAGGDFLANVPMENILEMYGRIQSREDALIVGPRPVSAISARLYFSEAIAFSEAVQAMIVLHMKVRAEDSEGSSVEDIQETAT
ncbi:hypothetical protein B0H16DRAFT_1596040 [Mycena metata]|uniref:Uncharacterized protein n=1 Tax=Mycena metata TaxID=1033252 RepID=A0AAD7HPG4_9AGAR|nr:hypothetical protein B0H16DRAFT_1596032 [Mycena metata]KAJ7724558.1 hypothetical protein B0H16DRAFT_1596040 [Mycena metata]